MLLASNCSPRPSGRHQHRSSLQRDLNRHPRSLHGQGGRRSCGRWIVNAAADASAGLSGRFEDFILAAQKQILQVGRSAIIIYTYSEELCTVNEWRLPP